MARMIQCIKLKNEPEGLDFPPYPGELGKRLGGERLEGSVEAMAGAPEDVGERVPAQSRRSVREEVPRGAGEEALLRRGRGPGGGVRAEELRLSAGHQTRDTPGRRSSAPQTAYSAAHDKAPVAANFTRGAAAQLRNATEIATTTGGWKQ